EPMTTDHHDARHRFAGELDEIKTGMLELGALVLENTRRMAEALLDNRLDLARTVVGADEEIDQHYARLEFRVFEIMARQQPVAGDLRFLVASTRILYEIERSGDLAVNGAKGLLRREGYTMPPAIHSLVARLARGSTELFARGLEALRNLDPNAASAIDRADDDVDAVVGELYHLIGRNSDNIGFDLAIELSRIGRYMERIGDHAVNIAEHVTFVVTGAFPGSAELKDEGG
ncbi:MAG TPA: phosphate signaling complex protein PhoU, partial [Acidimicrobiia bacterium]|nr:phosphate signaling complex protein PhoU [Acidimicrobiia bacterium]